MGAAALHISYGQRTEDRERESFLAICRRLDIQEKLVVRNEALRAIGGSALTDEVLLCRPHAIGADIPVTYVPFRNAHFLSVAVSWAEVLGADKSLLEPLKQDSSGYPDCRPAYYEAFNQVIKAGTKEGTIEVVTPLIGLRKAEIVSLGLEPGRAIRFNFGHATVARIKRAGVCDSCVLRLAGRSRQREPATRFPMQPRARVFDLIVAHTLMSIHHRESACKL